MKLSIAIPSIHCEFKMNISNMMTFDDFINEIIIKCNSLQMKCYKNNLKLVIQEELATKDNWEMIKKKYDIDKHIISCLIIKPIECTTHK
jgi:hypothetical protein